MSTLKNSFASSVGNDFEPDHDDNVFDSLFNQYERVVVNSIITSFALDAVIFRNDKNTDGFISGVDTINSVRETGNYSNTANKTVYENRGDYDSGAYHSHSEYRKVNKQYSEQRKAGNLDDAYTGKRFSRNESHDLDHVISAYEIHNDRGRMLAGLRGVDLANVGENLRPTNQRTNRTKKANTMDDFLDRYGDEYSNKQQERMRTADREARDSYNRKINNTYYKSEGFLKNTGVSIAKSTGRMALRQALGFVLAEVWFSVKDSLARSGTSFAEKLKAIGLGIKDGFARAKEKCKELLSKLKEGAVAGALSQITAILYDVFIAIFFKSAKNISRIIRQTWASVVEAAKIAFFNPDNLPFSERMKAVLKIIATGASVVLGSVVMEAVGVALKPLEANVPFLGGVLSDIISIFAGTLCTGFLTVTLLYFIDSNPFGDFFTKAFDKTVDDYKRQAKIFEAYAATLQKLDIEKFEKETTMYHELASSLETAKDDNELNILLKQAAKQIGISIPWNDDRSFKAFLDDDTTAFDF